MGRLRPRRQRRPTDPGSSTEEDFKELTDAETNAVRRQSLTNQKSLIFHFVRYPLLFAIIILCLLNLVLYTLSRSLVLVFEFLYSFVNCKTIKLEKELYQSVNYEEFLERAHELDLITGAAAWKTEPSDEIAFDELLLLSITRRLKRDSGRHRTLKLMESLRNSACKQDLAGIENEILYSRCYSGTKYTVDRFVEEVITALENVYESPDVGAKEKADFFKQVSVTYGRTALCLSGGATLGYFHLGVMKALWQQRLLPLIITGTSAGAMMAAMVCVRTDDELHEIFDPSLSSRIHCLSTPWSRMFQNFIKTGALLEDEFFREESSWFTKGDMTFLEAHALTGRILNVSVMSNEGHSKTKILNYINSPHITIRSAVVASSAIPGILPATHLYRKTPQGQVVKYFGNGKLWRDGSMRADIPERELQQLFRVKYTIVSQVNPHVSLFFFRPRGHPGRPSVARRWRGGFVSACLVKIFLLDIHKWLSFIRDMELLPRLFGANFSNIWTQSFEGNLTILPRIRIMNWLTISYDPSYKRLATYLSDGANATFPTISAISNRMRVEQAIGNFLALSRNDALESGVLR